MRTFRKFLIWAIPVLVTSILVVSSLPAETGAEGSVDSFPAANKLDRESVKKAVKLIKEGRKIFRFDTFGSESFWSDSLRIHEAVATVDPTTALAVGLKVDVNALPGEIRNALASGAVDLTDPAVTKLLLELNAVVGLKGTFNGVGDLSQVGITCALCHSTVDDSFAPGIGNRLDGWANRDLNVGTIIGLAPNLQPFVDLLGVDEATVRKVLKSWGPGKFDASLNLDGKAFRPDGKAAAVLIPPAFGLAGINLHTWTGWGSVAHWNAFVSNLEMGGTGTFIDRRLKNRKQFPIATKNKFYEVRNDPDLTTDKLAALHFYQLSLQAPEAPKGSFNETSAMRGEALFKGKARCADCHVPPIFTEPGYNLHTPEEIGIDAFQADRSPTKMYRTAPLKGLWTHTKGGFFHDGRFKNLKQVIDHYNEFFKLGLTKKEKNYLIEYLMSL